MRANWSGSAGVTTGVDLLLHRISSLCGEAVAAQVAQIAHTSLRHLSRLFMVHAGIAPLQYLRRLRLEVTKTALLSGRNVTQAAEQAGFSSDTQLRRTWHQFKAEGTPSKNQMLSNK